MIWMRMSHKWKIFSFIRIVVLLFIFTCGCITFVGLIIIAIKKISYTKSLKPIRILTISAQVTGCIPAIQPKEEQQDEFELQSHSQIINVAPIHFEEESVGSLENIDMNLPLENNHVENLESEQTTEILYFNNRTFNPNLISSAGLALLFVIIFILLPSAILVLRFADDLESFVFKTHIYFCFPTLLPIGYFIFNPKHLIPALKILFDIWCIPMYNKKSVTYCITILLYLDTHRLTSADPEKLWLGDWVDRAYNRRSVPGFFAIWTTQTWSWK